MNDQLQAKLNQAISTAASELPEGTHIDDLVDCVAGQLTLGEWDQIHVGEVYAALRKII